MMTTIEPRKSISIQNNQLNLINQGEVHKIDFYKNSNARSIMNRKPFGSSGKGSSFSDIIASIEHDGISATKGGKKKNDKKSSLKKKKSKNLFLIDDNQLKSKGVFKRKFDKAAIRIQTWYRTNAAKRKYKIIKFNFLHEKDIVIIQKTFRMYYQRKKYEKNLKLDNELRVRQQQQKKEQQKKRREPELVQQQQYNSSITTTTSSLKKRDSEKVVLDDDEKLQIELRNIQKRKEKKINNMINKEQKKLYQVNKLKELKQVIAQLKDEKFTLESSISDTQHQINILNRSIRTKTTKRESLKKSEGYNRIMEMVKDDENKEIGKKIDAQKQQIASVEKNIKKVNKKIKRSEKYAKGINNIVDMIEKEYDTGISLAQVGCIDTSKEKEDVLLSKIITKINDILVNC